MKRFFPLVALLVACSSNDPAPTPTPKQDCKGDCGPHYEDFFDEGKVADLYIDFPASVTAPDSCVNLCTDPNDDSTCELVCHPTDPGWLNYLWSKWGHCPGGEFVPAQIRYDSPDDRGDVTMQNVGVRLRGSKTRSANAIQGLKLDFDIAPEERDANGGKRHFADLNRINLLSIEGAGVKSKESSLLIQCLAYKVMRENGVPAPRCNHLNVYVNGKFYGVMQNAEVVKDGRFLNHAFENDDGTLYEASSGCPPYLDSQADLQYSATAGAAFTAPYSPVNAPTPQKAAYDVIEYQPFDQGQGGQGGAGPGEEPDPGEKPADMSRAEWSVVSHPDKTRHAEAELIPMLKCGDVDTTPDEADFKACISEWIDVEEWLRTIAGESLMPTLESFMVMRNYYLYFMPEAGAPHGGRFQLYSWDYDTAFQRSACYPSNCDLMTSTAAWFGPFPGKRAALAIRLQTAFKAEYCDALNSFLSEAYRPELLDYMASVLEPSIELVPGGFLAPPSKGGGPVVTREEWEAEVDEIRTFIETHTVTAQAQIDELCN